MVLIGILILCVLAGKEVAGYVFKNRVLSQQVLERCTEFQRVVVSGAGLLQEGRDEGRVAALAGELEAFAAYVSGLSRRDEILAYNVQGRTFCRIVERLEEEYGVLGAGGERGCGHVRKLYDAWREQ